jgi:DNA-binding MarR family transcriptional regulator
MHIILLNGKRPPEKELLMVVASNKENLTPWICLISRVSTLFVGREMGRIGFGPGQFFLLSELYAEEGLSQDELSRRVGVDKSNTSRALAKLEKYGLIRRESDQKNHRVKKIYLEPKALKIKKEFRKIQNQWNAELLSGFSEKEKSELLSSLKKLANNAESVFYTDFPQAQPSGGREKQKA